MLLSEATVVPGQLQAGEASPVSVPWFQARDAELSELQRNIIRDPQIARPPTCSAFSTSSSPQHAVLVSLGACWLLTRSACHVLGAGVGGARLVVCRRALRPA